MKPFFFSIFFLFLLVFPAFTLDLESASAPFSGIDISTLKERSYPIASPLFGGPLRILFFGERNDTGFSVREVASRLECNVETILTAGRSRLGTREPWIRFQPSILSDSTLSAKAAALFGKEWDVIWLDYEIGALAEPIRRALLDRIRSGCGLLYVGNKGDVRSLVTSGKFDENQLDMVSYGGPVKPQYAGFMGKGIVFVLPSLDSAVTIQEVGDYYAQAVHTLILASGHQSSLKVIGREKPSRNLELEAMSIMNFQMAMINSGKTVPRGVMVRYRDRNGKTAHESLAIYSIENGKTYLRIRYPMLPVGRYSLDISVFEGESVAALAGTSINVTSEETISDIVVWDQGVRVGKFVSGSIKTAREIKEGMNIKAELLDQWGRQAGFSELQPVPGRKSVDFTFKITRPARGALTLRVTFYKNNIIDHVLEKPILTKYKYDPERFSFIVGGDRSFKPWQLDGYDRLIEEGVTGFAWEMTAADPGPFYSTTVTISRRGTAVVPMFAVSDFFSGQKSVGVMKTGAGKSRNPVSIVTAVMDTLRNLDIPACWINAALPDSILLRSEARKTGDFGKWLDSEHSRMDASLRAAGEIAQAVSRMDSTAKTGISGYSRYLEEFAGLRSSSDPEGFPGFTMYPQDAGTCFSGDSGMLLSLALFKQPGGMNCLITGGESWRRGNEALLRAAPWQSLFLGLNGIWWSNGFEGTGAALAPGLTVTPAFSLVAEETREIMGGIDLLLYGAKRHRDGIAIVYSPISILAAYATEEPGSHAYAAPDDCLVEYERAGAEKADGMGMQPYRANAVLRSAHAFLQACLDAGYSPAVVSEDQVNNTWLKKNGIRVLFLPFMQSISEVTAARIEDFARSGGTVIADVRTGIMDEHLAMRHAGRLDSLFGVNRIPERKTKETEGAFQLKGIVDGLPSGLTIDSCRGETGITPAGGARALGEIDGAPALIVNSVSGGKSVLLNMGMESYERLRIKGAEASLRTLVSWCIRNGGVGAPSLSLSDSTGKPPDRIQSTVFRDGNSWYIGLLMEPGTAGMPNTRNQTCRVQTDNLAKSAFIYDVRRGAFMGRGNSFSVDLSPGEAKLFSLLPYRVQDMDIKLKNNVINPGGSIHYQVNIQPQDAEIKPGRHIFHVSVIGPDGSERKFFSDSLAAPEGSIASSLGILPVDPPGRWRLKVKDIASGKSIERVFMVMPGNK